MRTFLVTTFFTLLLAGTTAFAGDVLVLQSLRVKPFEDALHGFKSVCKAEARTVLVADVQGGNVARLVREEHPRLILAIGAEALQKVKKIRDIPIIYLMVLNPEKIVDGGSNITGVELNVAPEKYLNLMERLELPKLKVGVIYNPAFSGGFVKKAQQTARSMGIEMVTKEVRHAREVPELLAEMKGSCTAFWMLPDPTVITPETVEFLLLFTQQHHVPVVTFAGKYVDMGALVSLDIDGFDLGRQGAEMANRILNGARVGEVTNSEARRTVLRVNRKVAKKLGIDLTGIERF